MVACVITATDTPTILMTTVQIVFGAIVAIATSIWIENLRKPKLTLKILPPSDAHYTNRPATDARFLSVHLLNKPLPHIMRWMSRSAALQCHGTITFHHLNDGQNVFGRAMPIRWASQPEPVPIPISFQGQIGAILDPSRFTLTPRIDVYTGEGEALNIAAKFDNESECYGWSNESYFSNPKWRNPDWRLPSARYLVRVTVQSAGQTFTRTFRLVADVPRGDFRLEDARPEDRVYG